MHFKMFLLLTSTCMTFDFLVSVIHAMPLAVQLMPSENKYFELQTYT